MTTIEILDDYMKEQRGNLDPFKIDVLYDYTNLIYNRDFTFIFYKNILKKYPDKKDDIDYCLSRFQLKELIENLELKEESDILLEMFKSFSIPCDLVLYRGTDMETIRCTSVIKKTKEDIKIGDKITNLVPWSTTLSKNIASSFACGKYPPIILKINMPKNSKGIWLRPFSIYKNEEEVLIPPDISFIIEKEENEDNQYGRKIKSLILKPIGCDNNGYEKPKRHN